MTGLGIDTPHRPYHLGPKQDVVDRDYFEYQLDAGQGIDTGIEEYIVEQQLFQRWGLHVLPQAAGAPPGIRARAAPMRDDESQLGEILEQVRSQELHESGGIGIDVVR